MVTLYVALRNYQISLELGPSVINVDCKSLILGSVESDESKLLELPAYGVVIVNYRSITPQFACMRKHLNVS